MCEGVMMVEGFQKAMESDWFWCWWVGTSQLVLCWFARSGGKWERERFAV